MILVTRSSMPSYEEYCEEIKKLWDSHWLTNMGVEHQELPYLDQNIPRDESFERVHFLLGRYERSASEFYSEYVANNKLFETEPIKRMSKLTNNLLHGIDYDYVKRVREKNYAYLHQELKGKNLLKLADKPGTFMYPLMLKNGAEIRKALQNQKKYIPTLWSNVLSWCKADEIEYCMAENILPLPIDQRYTIKDMERLAEGIRNV